MKTKSLLIMAFVIPLWLLVGRGLLGSFGWVSFIYFFTIAPFIFIVLLALFFVARDLPPFSTLDSNLLLALYASLLLHGFFLTDAGDAEPTIDSVASNIFGESFRDASTAIAFGLFVIAGALLTTVIVRIVMLRSRYQKTQNATDLLQ